MLNVKTLNRKAPGFWQRRLHENYGHFEHWEHWSAVYGLAGRLGYASARDAWDDNPLIQGSVNPDDFSVAILPL